MTNAVAVFAPGQRLTDTLGVPYALCTVNFYEAGTETDKIVYADASLTVALGSTVYSDSAGYPVTSNGSTTKTLVYTSSDPYKVRGYDSDGVVVFEHDNVKGAPIEGSSAGGSFLTQDAGDIRYTRNANALAAVTGLTTGDKVPVYVASAAGNRNIDWSDLSTDLLGEWRTAGHVFAPSTARILFQSAPPTGWTLDTNANYNDAALKFTTGTPGVSAGVAFSSLFASQTLTGTVGNDTPSTAKTAAHTHDTTFVLTSSGNTSAPAGGTGFLGTSTTRTSQSTGGGSAHNHSLTMSAFNMAVKFVSVNIAVKA